MTRNFMALLFAALTLPLTLMGTGAAAQTTGAAASVVALSVITDGPLPGFGDASASPWLAVEMDQADVSGWDFAPATGAPPDRVEWHFALIPYAGGSVRQFFPMPQVQRMFGNLHMVSAEARLYLDDKYQTLMFGQAVIQGGAQDKALAAFVMRMTQQLLGEHGAYRSIDMSPAAPRPAPQQ
jgi:hypothetical protein